MPLKPCHSKKSRLQSPDSNPYMFLRAKKKKILHMPQYYLFFCPALFILSVLLIAVTLEPRTVPGSWKDSAQWIFVE